MKSQGTSFQTKSGHADNTQYNAPRSFYTIKGHFVLFDC